MSRRRRREDTDRTRAGAPPGAEPDVEGVDGRAEGPGPDREEIARRAFELYLARGSQPGRDLEDWFRAVAELQGA